MTYANAKIYRKTYHEANGSEASPIVFINESLLSMWGLPAELGLDVSGSGSDDVFGIAGKIKLIAIKPYAEGSGNHIELVEYPFCWWRNTFGVTNGYLAWGDTVIVTNVTYNSIEYYVTKTAGGGPATTLSLSVSNTAFNNYAAVLCVVEGEFIAGPGITEFSAL